MPTSTHHPIPVDDDFDLDLDVRFDDPCQDGVRRVAIVADTLHLECLATNELDATMTIPLRLGKALDTVDIAYHAWVAIHRVLEDRPPTLDSPSHLATLTRQVLDQFLVEVTQATTSLVPGPGFTFLDPRLHDNTPAMVRRARSILKRFDRAGVSRDRIVFSILATPQAIRACAHLTDEGINTALNIVASLEQGQENLDLSTPALQCVEAGAVVVQVSVGSVIQQVARNAKKGVETRSAIDMVQDYVSLLRSAQERMDAPNLQVVLADVPNFSTLKTLRGYDAVVLSKKQIESLNGRVVTTRDPPPRALTPVSSKLTSVCFPTKTLPTKNQTSGKSLPFALTHQIEVTTLLESILHGEVRWRVELEGMDLRHIVFKEPREESQHCDILTGEQGKESAQKGSMRKERINGTDEVARGTRCSKKARVEGSEKHKERINLTEEVAREIRERELAECF